MALTRDMNTHLVGNTNPPEAKAGKSKEVKRVYQSLGIKTLYAAKGDYFNSIDTSNGLVYQEYSSVKGIMPNVTGMGLKDALYLLGNAGLKTAVTGSGKVVGQSIPAGNKISKGLRVEIQLK
jgi:cell division protein FtsI (penicillin-binding protein 3)